MKLMNDHFILFVDDKTIFNSKWLDPDEPSYINSQSKIIRNPNPPDYFIDNLPKNFVVFLDINPKENMAQYECMLIIDPSLSETDRNSSVDNLKKLFKEHSISIEKEDVW